MSAENNRSKLRTWFDHVDKDGSGELDGEELKRALAEANLNFSLMSAKMLVKLFDEKKEGKLDFAQFTQLYTWIMRQKKAYMEFDTDRSGTLDYDNGEVLKAIKAAGFNLDEHAFEAAFSAYDPDCDKELSMTEFVGLCCFLTLCLNTFTSFDSIGRQKIELSFCQFVYACAHCK